MREEAALHVPPIRLWQSLCGGTELATSDYEHVIHCFECEQLAMAIGDALDEIEGTLRQKSPGADKTS
jgi:hypothetical protein